MGKNDEKKNEYLMVWHILDYHQLMTTTKKTDDDDYDVITTYIGLLSIWHMCIIGANNNNDMMIYI
mgnify:CR=1 FL=1